MIGMAKLRNDLEGVVYVGGAPFTAGAELPKGAVVSKDLLDSGAPSGGAGKKTGSRASSKGE